MVLSAKRLSGFQRNPALTGRGYAVVYPAQKRAGHKPGGRPEGLTLRWPAGGRKSCEEMRYIGSRGHTS